MQAVVDELGRGAWLTRHKLSDVLQPGRADKQPGKDARAKEWRQATDVLHTANLRTSI